MNFDERVLSAIILIPMAIGFVVYIWILAKGDRDGYL